ncbi:MAG TPA: hypothetical protein PKH93_00845 [Chitinophagales bacterium]|nr:hypothetical protein [Chitinophagales bacterium]
MAANSKKSYSKFTYEDLKTLGLQTIVGDLLAGKNIVPIAASSWLIESLKRGAKFALHTEKAKSEFIIAPILNELHERNENVFAVYSGFNFKVDVQKGLQGFCDFLLAKLPLNIVPDTPIIAVVEAKLNEAMTTAVPQCAAEMYASRLWNERYGQPQQCIYGIVTTGDNWLILRLREGMTVEVDMRTYSLSKLEEVLGVLQYIIDQFK